MLEGAVLKTAEINKKVWDYHISNQNFMNQSGSQIMKTSQGHQAIERVEMNTIVGVPTRIDYHDKSIFLHANVRNDVYKVNFPEGNSTSYGYDSRGRLERITQSPRPGSDLPNIVTSAGYPSGCPNPKTCNKPMWVEDGKGNRTDYTYHAPSGQIATVTLPADEHGVRPQTRYKYEQMYAWYKNASGAYRRADSPIWMLVSESQCISSSALESGGCQKGASDEVKITYDYGPQSGPNNLFLRGKVVTSDGVSRRTCFGYDRYGNRVSETSPNANLSACP